MKNQNSQATGRLFIKTDGKHKPSPVQDYSGIPEKPEKNSADVTTNGSGSEKQTRAERFLLFRRLQRALSEEEAKKRTATPEFTGKHDFTTGIRPSLQKPVASQEEPEVAPAAEISPVAAVDDRLPKAPEAYISKTTLLLKFGLAGRHGARYKSIEPFLKEIEEKTQAEPGKLLTFTSDHGAFQAGLFFGPTSSRTALYFEPCAEAAFAGIIPPIKNYRRSGHMPSQPPSEENEALQSFKSAWHEMQTACIHHEIYGGVASLVGKASPTALLDVRSTLMPGIIRTAREKTKNFPAGIRERFFSTLVAVYNQLHPTQQAPHDSQQQR
jgi:hypothetical protein